MYPKKIYHPHKIIYLLVLFFKDPNILLLHYFLCILYHAFTLELNISNKDWASYIIVLQVILNVGLKRCPWRDCQQSLNTSLYDNSSILVGFEAWHFAKNIKKFKASKDQNWWSRRQQLGTFCTTTNWIWMGRLKMTMSFVLNVQHCLLYLGFWLHFIQVTYVPMGI
jgi:hypothetical protein